VPPVLGLKLQSKPPDRQQAVPALGCRWGLGRPINDASAVDELITQCLRMRHEQPEQGMLRAELKAKCATELGVALQIAAQHDAAPGQIWATWRSMGMSTLA
jgi:hypothetical protein